MKLLNGLFLIALSSFSTSYAMQESYSEMSINGKKCYFPTQGGDVSTISMTAFFPKAQHVQKNNDFDEQEQIDQDDLAVVQQDYSEIIAGQEIKAIIFKGAGDVIVQAGDKQKITVETTKKGRADVEITSDFQSIFYFLPKEQVLTLSSNKSTKIYITLSMLERVLIFGSGHMNLPKNFKNCLKIEMCGMGDYTFTK